MPRRFIAGFLGALILLMGSLALVTFSVSEASNQEEMDFSAQAGRLMLHVGEVSTSRLPNLLVDAPERFEGHARYVVQLDGPITPARREALERIGVRLDDYLPHFSYVARLDGVQPASLSAVSFLSWVGDFQEAWKLDSEFGQRNFQTDLRRSLQAEGKSPIVVTLFEGEPAESTYVAIEQVGGTVHSVEPVGGNVTLWATVPTDQVAALVSGDTIQFIEEAPEITLRNNTNRWIVQSNQSNVTPFYDNGIHGEGQIVGIIDGRVAVDHCSFSDAQPIGPLHRKIEAYNTTLGVDTHGTHVAGTAVGDSGSDANTRGVAYLGRLVYDTIPTFTEGGVRAVLIQHHNQGGRVHTNSWGDDGTTSYNSLARGFDSFSHDFEESLCLLAVTNLGNLRNPENAKNLLAVGASQDTPSQGSHCTGGTGPTADGRRKPEIYAPGCSTTSSNGTGCSTTNLTGTSMACPAVAGTAMLIRQYYVEGYHPTGIPFPADSHVPSSALLKATLLNSAVDMTGIGGYPSNQEGWGRVLAGDAAFFDGDTRKLLLLEDIRNDVGLSTGNQNEYLVQVNGSGEKLKITLTFTDAPASASTGTGLAAVNDLDLEVVSPGGQTYLGNVFSGGVSVIGGVKDDRNNVEQVHLNNPQVGSWTVRVRGAAVNEGTQGFALVATGDVVAEEPPLRITFPNGLPNEFAPETPTMFDVEITAGAESLVPGSATLHYRYDGGAFLTATLAAQGGDLFTATLPAALCADTPEFYVSAQGDQGSGVSNPSNAPTSFFSAVVGVSNTLFTDDFQADLGWSVENLNLTDGPWERGVPAGAGDRGDPLSDADGSGSCYLTDNVAGDSDVDGGPTRLISPALALAGTDATIEYAAWFSNDDGDDSMTVQISANGTSTWVTTETIGPGGGGGWQTHGFRVNDFITPTDSTRIRVAVSDNPNNSVTEGGIDAFRITSFDCDDGEPIEICGVGSVNVNCGPVEDVLSINGSTGGPERTITVATDTAMSFNLTESSAESGNGQDSNALVYFWFAAPAESDIVILPKNFGAMCFGPFLVQTRAADVTFNSVGFENKAGVHDATSPPPVIPDGGSLEFHTLPGGFGVPMDVTVQGIVEDPGCTQANLPFSVCNGIVIQVQ